jgi:hypothetical protein
VPRARGRIVCVPAAPLSEADIERFVADGFIRLDGAFDRAVAAQVCERLYDEIRLAHRGFDVDDPATWPAPVLRFPGSIAQPFFSALMSARLEAAFDQLVGKERWQRAGLGTFAVRFPHPVEPDDAGWHTDGSYVGTDESFWSNVTSRGRALLMLLLFTDVGIDDAPTRIRVGSHLLIPRLLEPAGEEGVSAMELARRFPDFDALPLTHATGRAGDAYLCHPFLVHAADRHRGSSPRIIAQPPLAPTDGELRLGRSVADHRSPVERAVRIGLDLPGERARP